MPLRWEIPLKNCETFESEDGQLYLVKIDGLWLWDDDVWLAVLLSVFPYIHGAPVDVQNRVSNDLNRYLEPDGKGGLQPNANGRVLLEKQKEDEATRERWRAEAKS